MQLINYNKRRVSFLIGKINGENPLQAGKLFKAVTAKKSAWTSFDIPHKLGYTPDMAFLTVKTPVDDAARIISEVRNLTSDIVRVSVYNFETVDVGIGVWLLCY